MRRLLLALALSLAGCHSTPATGDGGHVDAGPLDAGNADAGHLDAGPTDAGPTDAGPSDAGPSDAGSLDSGSALPLIPVGLDAYRMWDRLPVPPHRHARVHAQHLRPRGRQRGRGRQPLPPPGADDRNVAPRRRGPRRPLLLPRQPLARQPLALRGRRHRQRRHRDQHRRPDTSPCRTRVVPPRRPRSRPARRDLVDHPGRRPRLGARSPSRSRSRIAYGRTHYGTGYFIYHTVPRRARRTSRSRSPPGRAHAARSPTSST